MLWFGLKSLQAKVIYIQCSSSFRQCIAFVESIWNTALVEISLVKNAENCGGVRLKIPSAQRPSSLSWRAIWSLDSAKPHWSSTAILGNHHCRASPGQDTSCRTTCLKENQKNISRSLPPAPVLGVDFDLPSCRACHCAGAAWPAVRRFVLAAPASRGERALTVPTLRLTLPKNIRPRDANVAKIRSSQVNSAEYVHCGVTWKGRDVVTIDLRIYMWVPHYIVRSFSSRKLEFFSWSFLCFTSHTLGGRGWSNNWVRHRKEAQG